MPEHRIQIKVPRVADAQRGPEAAQNKDKGVQEACKEQYDGPRSAGVYWMIEAIAAERTLRTAVSAKLVLG